MIGDVLISAEEIRVRVRELAEEISRDYRGENLLMVGILKGAFVFLSDLVREMTIPVHLDFLGVASYGAGTASSGEVKVFKDLDRPVAGWHVLIVEDIIDSGLTTKTLLSLLEVHKPRSIRICSLLNKRAGRRAEVEVDYVGFEISDRFVVGYGLDVNEDYRYLPDIHALEAEQ